MKIIHITDTHLRGDNLLSFGKCDTSASVKKAMEYFQNMPEKDLPDFFVATGDLADNGNHTAYGKVHDYFASLPRPVYCVPGNHDNRADMLRLLGSKMCPVEEDKLPMSATPSKTFMCASSASTPSYKASTGAVSPTRLPTGWKQDLTKTSTAWKKFLYATKTTSNYAADTCTVASPPCGEAFR